MEWMSAGITYIMVILIITNEMSMNVQAKNNSKQKAKEKTAGNVQKNICDITDRDSKVHCYCENTREPRNATKAECWVFNGGIPRDDLIWQSFASQPTLQTLAFNVRVDGALGYVPTKALHYLQRLRSVNIKYGNIAEITSFAFANLTYLKEVTLAHNQIETLQPYAFAHLLNISTINLDENMILEIAGDVFVDLPRLQKLVFTKNNISAIKDGAFQHTFNLLELDLNKNNIFNLNRRTFDGLANLRKLDLRKNRIYNLTEYTFAELWNLQELLLGKNELKFISERAFDGLSQLRKLSLDDNKLAALPSRLFEGVRGLSSLDLRSNELYALTFDNIKPILDNLKPQNSNLLVEENNFVCDCRLKWMHSLRNDTKSQNTRDSLDIVTCKMDPPVVSSAYNKMSNNKYELIVDIINTEPKPTKDIDKTENDKNIIAQDDIATDAVQDTNDISVPGKKGDKKNVLKLLPESLPCPREIKKTTETPAFIDSVVPVQKEMKTFRFKDQQSSASTVNTSVLLRRISVLWVCIFFRFH